MTHALTALLRTCLSPPFVLGTPRKRLSPTLCVLAMAESTEDQAITNGAASAGVESGGGGDTAVEKPVENGLPNGDINGEVKVKSEKSESGEKKHHSSSHHSSSHKSSSKDKDRHSSSKHSSSSSKHHSSSSSKDKDKDRHSSSKHSSSSSKHHSSSSSSSKHHSSSSSSKDKDKHHSSSSKDKDKHHSSSSSSRDKDKDRERSSSKHHSSSSKHGSSSSSSKDKDKHSSSSSSKDKDKHHSSSSSKDKDKHRSSSSHGHSSSSKHSSSSSKHHSSSSSSKDKDKDRHHSKDKDRHSSSKHSSSSSSRKDKDKSSSSNKDAISAEGAPDLNALASTESADSGDDFRSPISRSRDAPINYAELEEDDDDPLAALEAMYENEKQARKQKEAEEKADVKTEDSQDSQDEVEVKQEVKEEVKVEEEEDMEEDYIKEEPEEEEEEYLPETQDDDEDEVPLASRSKYKEDSEEDEEYEPETKPKKGRKKADSEDDEYEPESKPKKGRKKADSEDDEYEPEKKKKKVKKEKKPKVEVKEEAGSDDDMPLSSRVKDEDEEDEKPLAARANKKKATKKRKGDSDDGPANKKVKSEPATKASPTKATKKAAAEVEEKWKWWEEEKREDGVKWEFLEHRGPMFAPPYVRLPKHVQFFYDGKQMDLSEATEEVATFYGRMLDHDYTSMEVFNKNFMKDWRSVMTESEAARITDLSKCNFKQILTYFKEQSEIRKARSKEDKKIEKDANAAIVEEYGFCTIDGHKEKIGNFRLEPPGLFRGRGAHPKMGCLKKRLIAQQITINCSKDAVIPEPPPGQRWKEVRHDNTVSWLASWIENVQGQGKYIMLNPASRLKGEKDWQKYEKARELHKCVDKIRANYYEDFKSKEMRIRQRSVAMYFIDKLALRAGNEKDEDSADTVGCCSLRWEHIKLHPEMDGKQYVVEFDFLGKDSIRYYNKVAVEKRVFKNLDLFMEGKGEGDDLFDRLNTAVLNKHLSSLMEGLTAKVFRTYNASKTLQEQLDLLTNEDDPEPAKMLSYNRANRKVAILCNHQRAASKNFDEQMGKLQVKIEEKREKVKEAKGLVKQAKQDFKAEKTEKNKKSYEMKKKSMERLELQLHKLEVQATDKDENKLIALGTSKLNYLDPRISVAWCKKWEVPIEKVYTKTHRDKFAWAIDMTEDDFQF